MNHDFKNILPLLVMAVFYCSCCNLTDRDFNLSKLQYDYMKSFKQGDTIYFENQTTFDLDTILILKIDSIQKRDCGWLNALPANNYVYVSINHLPNDKWTGTSQDDTSYSIKYQSLISIEKNVQVNTVSIGINYRDFYASMNDSIGKIEKNELTLGKIKLTNWILVKNDFPKRVVNDDDIDEIYWTFEYGLTAYKTKNNQLWIKKINVP